MNPRRTMFRLVMAAVAVGGYAALSVVSVGCGGSNNNDSTTSTNAPIAVFTPDTPTPADGSITMLQGTTSGAAVNVRITVTQVPSFFGAAFRIDYDPAALFFNGMSSSSSFLAEGITDPSQLYFYADSQNSPNQIVVTATRFAPAVPVDVTTTSDLVVLNFVARLPILPGATVGRVDFAAPMQVCNGTVAPPGCVSIPVTWSGGGVAAD